MPGTMGDSNPNMEGSTTFSMRDVENELVDITATSSSTSASSKVKLLFAKSKVYVHPTPRAKDNIPGWFALVERPSGPSSSSNVTRKSTIVSDESNTDNILLSWIPESLLPASQSEYYVKVELSDLDIKATDYSTKQDVLIPPPPQGGMYAFSLPLSQVYSLLVRPPRIGWWSGSLVVNARGGETHPALFFHDAECKSTQLQQKRRRSENFDPFGAHGEPYWGGDEVLKWLRKYVNIQRSTIEPQLYLIDPSSTDLSSFSPSRSSTPPSASTSNAQMDPLTAKLKEARWTLLEKFARVTAFGKRTASELMEQPLVKEQIIPRLPPQMRHIVKSKEVQKYAGEYDSAREYLARWAAGVAEEAERQKGRRGEEVGIWGSGRSGWEEMSELGGFEVLSVAPPVRVERKAVLDERTWKKFFDHTGRLAISVTEVKEAVFHGGVEATIRPEVWKFLLGFYPWSSSTDERKAIRRSKRDEYVRLKGKWWNDLELQEDAWFKDQKSRIEKDVHRTDRTISPFMEEDLPHPDPDSQYSGTNAHLEMLKDMLMTYNMYDAKRVGYVQGMSDLLSIVYAIMQDDSDAFWCFCGFMDRMVYPLKIGLKKKYNFLLDQTGMRRQLVTLKHLTQLMIPKLYAHLEKSGSDEFFFLFRQLLVWFKREFSWDDVCTLWEVLWTDYLSGQFHLFVALGILDKHKEVIMGISSDEKFNEEHLREFDEVLKYINDLSMTIDLESTLVRAEVLFYRFQGTVELIDKKNAELAREGKAAEGTISDELRGLLKKEYPKE